MFKQIVPRGLFARTILILILPIFLLQGFGVYLFYERHWDKLAQRLSASVAGDIGLITEWYEEDGGWLGPAQRLRLRRYIDLDARPGVEDNQGASKATYSYLTGALEQTMDGRKFQLLNPGGENLTAVIQTSRGPLSVEVPKRRLYSSTTKIFVLWLAGLTLLLATIATVFLKRQIKPILRLATAVWSHSRSRDVSLKLEGAEEVRLATAAFMDMQERLNRHRDQRHAILTGVRNDLQRPIDRIRMILDTVLPGHPDTPTMMADLREMERMVDGYLAYVRDNRDEPLQRVPLKTLLEEAEKLSGVNNLKIDTRDLDEELTLMVRPLAITRAFTNLMRNAGMHGATTLVVEARPLETDDGELVLLSFEDDGPGMDEKSMREALQPIAQGIGEGGRGFGLSIAADIVESHSGSLELSKGVKGLRVSLVLPA